MQDGESIHQLTDETKSLKSLGSSDGVVHKSGSIDENLRDGGVGGESKISDGGLANGMVHGDDDGGDGILGGDDFGGDDFGDGGADFGVTSDGDDGGTYGDGHPYSEDDGDGPNISITSDTKDPYSDGHPDYHHESTKQTMPTIDVVPATEPQAPHMSLSSLQDEVRLVATEVLSRTKSGRILAADAEMATFLLLERMQGLLDPRLAGELPCLIE
jgi:hypothetical protein